MTAVDRATAIRDALASLAFPVQLTFFEQSIGCDSCLPTRQLVQQIAELSPYVSLEVLNLVLDKDRAVEHGIDRAPAIVVSAPGRNRIRFYGPPVGHELISLLDAIRITASGETGLSEESRTQLATLTSPVALQVFFTPSCVYCPEMVNLANRLAVESALVSATAIDATQYPDLVRRYAVNGVPKTIIGDQLEIMGVVSESEIVKTVLAVAGLQ